VGTNSERKNCDEVKREEEPKGKSKGRNEGETPTETKWRADRWWDVSRYQCRFNKSRGKWKGLERREQRTETRFSLLFDNCNNEALTGGVRSVI
jgi:hypothetical protein